VSDRAGSTLKSLNIFLRDIPTEAWKNQSINVSICYLLKLLTFLISFFLSKKQFFNSTRAAADCETIQEVVTHWNDMI
jgi:hypothetical protein